MRKVLCVFIILGLAIFYFAINLFAATLYVPDDFPTIQEAVNAAQDKDTILVHPGTYREEVKIDRKNLIIKSVEGPGVTFIIGGYWQYPAVYFNHCNEPINRIEGFNINHNNGSSAVYCGTDSSVSIIGNVIANTSSTGIVCNETDLIIIKDNTIEEAHNPGIISIESNNHIIIKNNTIRGCWREGINLVSGSKRCEIAYNIIYDNYNSGIFVANTGEESYICNNIIAHNHDNDEGGGIRIFNAHPLIKNNLIIGNTAGKEGEYAGKGGGIFNYNPAPSEQTLHIINNTIAYNAVIGPEYYHPPPRGGGVDVSSYSSNYNIENNIIAYNRGFSSSGIWVGIANDKNLDYCDLWENEWTNIPPGDGCIWEKPEFAESGEQFGEYYLSQISAGQSVDSPCLNAGSDTAQNLELHLVTTRTDEEADTDMIDMGFHYVSSLYDSELPLVFITNPSFGDAVQETINITAIATDNEGVERAEFKLNEVLLGIDYNNGDDHYEYSWDTTAIDDGPYILEVIAYDSNQNHGKDIMSIKVNNIPDKPFIVTAADDNPNLGPIIKVAFGRIGAVFAEFNAYNTQRWGANVACGDIDGEGEEEIVTAPGPGPGYGPQICAFELDGAPVPQVNFFAYNTGKWGANVMCGDIDGDGFDEIITGPGPGTMFGPQVRGWDYDDIIVASINSVNFFAYNTGKYGVIVACGDIDDDGFDEIITGPGPGPVFAPHVRAWNYDGEVLTPVKKVSFFAYATKKFGVNVSGGDIDSDHYDEIITGPGPGPGFSSHVRAFNYDNEYLRSIPEVSFLAYAKNYKFGVNVACGDIHNEGPDEIITGLGPGPDNVTNVKVWAWDGSGPPEVQSQYDPFGSNYGINVAAAD